MTVFFGSHASQKVIQSLEQAGFEAVYVGGAVRDYVLGKEATDIDIATSAEPQEVKKVFSSTVDVGIDHGTVLVLLDGESIEVTTYRTEGTYSDNRRPDTVQFVKTLKEDLRRRDFTMNALAMTKDGTFIDPFGGKQDIQAQTIRAVGMASERFQEDALRMLRGIRFVSTLGFEIEAETFNAIAANGHLLRNVSIERVKAEMDKLFMGITPLAALQYFEDTRLGNYLPLFPDEAVRLKQAIPFVSAMEGWAGLMLAGPFKPLEVARAFKLSRTERQFLKDVHTAYQTRKMRTYSIDDYYQSSLEVLFATEKLFAALNPKETTVGPGELVKRKKQLPIQSKEQLAVSGRDLIQWAETKGGKWTSDWLTKVEYAVLHQNCINERSAIKEWFLHEFKCQK
ncbi:CCA tRNA nucleotidyltransferase [Sporosarcina sp. HYO08]|uniref:CCA tRNA nucleotidyltransferase n=1 Tax=Sporosarcina sp. HYO08 TaxID=1759557 RepID=UPI000791F2C9|nr:CCA tRNA nucleotidyltransferase [Sporosarcina sp. HYO08]KXH81998.1 hypothetical protein AU377_07025 [Sporosarcina sp. HYO08]